MTATKTIKRNWLKKQIEAGNMEAKCNYVLTDDYAFDNAYNFRKTEWLPARISHPTYREIALQNGSVITQRDDEDYKEGALNFKDYDFTFSTGRAYRNDDGTISFYPLSGESYTLREVTK